MEFLLPIPVSLMQKAGTYYFVLHFKDSHADKYKDHQVKPALEMNQTAQQLPPIVYIHHNNWHIAWCLPGRGVIFRTVRADPAEYCVVRDFTSATGQSQVRAAINGGFFNIIRERGINAPKQDPFTTDPKRKVRMVAEVGIGTKGKWEYSRKEEALPAVGKGAKPGRWCFGMSVKGQISISPMEQCSEKGINHWC